MASDRDRPDVQQNVTSGRDAYVAAGDISIRNYGPAADPHAVERKLANVVLKQAEEVRSLLIGTDVSGDETANIEYARMPGRLREAEGPESGDLRSVLEYYQSLSPQRLVVIGAPGTGKTVLLLELQIRLLEERNANPETPIPVLISASAYDTGKKWEDWLAGHLSLQFSIPERTAAGLISSNRILPVVDGLDEMDPVGDASPERTQSLVRALNASMRGLDRAPVVVASRPGEYSRLVEGIDRARHVELFGLTGREAAGHLNRQFRTVSERQRWKPVLEALERDPGGPLAAELSTPWRLTLALAVFRRAGDPGLLLPAAGATGNGYSARVDAMLLDGYVPSAAGLYHESGPYAEPLIQRWLTELADDLAWQARHGRSAADITLHEWWRPRENWVAKIPYVVLVMLPTLGFLASFISLIGHPLNGSSIVMPFFAFICLGASGTLLPRTPFPRQTVSRTRLGAWLAARMTNGGSPRMRAMYSVGLKVLLAGIPAGFIVGLVTGYVSEGSAGYEVVIADGFVVAVSVGFVGAFLAGVATAVAYRFTTALARGLTTGLITGILLGLACMLVAGPGGGALIGLAAGSTTGVMDGFTSGLANFSPRARRPHTIIRANGLAALAGGLACGLIAGVALALMSVITGWFTSGITLGLIAGLTSGATTALAISARTWIRYHTAVAWNAIRGKGPLRFGKFLDWAVQAGVLRETGVAYQFRHRQLQDRLTSR